MSFYNLNDYEPVSERIAKFYSLYPNGRILTRLVSDPENFDVCRYKAFVYRHQNDEVPAATGYAVERRDTEVKKSKNGQEFYDVNYDSSEENAETSAIGRALANLGLSGSRRPSREEMQKVSKRPAPTATPPAPGIPSNTGNGNGKESMPAQSAQSAEVPANSTEQKVETLLKRMKEAEDMLVLKQLAREIQFLTPRLTQQQKVALKGSYFARKQILEDQLTAVA